MIVLFLLKKMYFCSGDSDLIRASPLEEGVDVFSFTFFYALLLGLLVFLFRLYKVLPRNVYVLLRSPNIHDSRFLSCSS